jgi:pimeloyl-ACP methyl ester carboxylesterase
MNFFKTTTLLQIPLLFLLVFTSCKKDESTSSPSIISAEGLISYEFIDSLSLDEIDKIKESFLTKFIGDSTYPASKYRDRMVAAKNPVKLYRVTYGSYIPETGKPTIATGLIALPSVTEKQLPMISYQHGTVFDKDGVPSVPSKSEEIQFMISQFAAQGYILIAADYFGLGNTSQELNSYFVRYSTEQACLDMYKAALQVLEKENIAKTKFFVNGWSQGGYNTMLFLRRLEQENIPVAAALTAAAPVDPQLFLSRGLFNPRSFDAIYTAAALCNLMMGVEHYNGLSGVTKRYINPEYYPMARSFYLFDSNFFDFLGRVPTKLNQAFTPELFADAKMSDSKFWQILAASEAYKWYSRTPLRAYYGMKDEAVPDFIASLAVEYMKKLGKQDATSHNAGEIADHRATYLESLVDARTWIDSFK